MVSRKPKEMPSDIAADISSADSLSFAGLVCIHDQCSRSQQGHDRSPPEKPNATNIQKQEPDFDFSYSTIASIALSPEIQSQPNALVPSFRPLPQSIPLQTNESQVLGQISIQDILQPRRSGRRSSCNAIAHSGSAKKTKSEVRKKVNKKLSSGNKSFGKKFIQSIATPCRTCRAVEPSQAMRAAQSVHKEMKLE